MKPIISALRNGIMGSMTMLLVLLPFQVASAVPAVDQQQPVIDITVGGLAVGGSSAQELAQVVTPGLSGMLTEVRFPVACSSGNLIVDIQGVAAGAPNGVVFTSQPIPATSLPPVLPPIFRSLVLSTPVSLVAGTPFAIVLTSDGECGVFQGPEGNPYPGGDAFFMALPNPPGWVPLGPPRDDLPFQTVVEELEELTVPFTAFSAQLELAPATGAFEIKATFMLGTGSDGIAPVTEDVTLQVGPYTTTIPAGSFTLHKHGRLTFAGVIDAVALKAVIRPMRGGGFAFKAEGTGVNLAGTVNPVTVHLTIGNDGGGTPVTAEFLR